MRTLATALESYQVDHNRPPSVLTGYPGSLLNGPSLINSALPGIAWVSYRFRRLTSPISYITTVFPDVFAKDGNTKVVGGGANINYDSFDYLDQNLDQDLLRAALRKAGLTSGGTWRVASCGPDLIQAFGGALASAPSAYGVDYDATNGTVSTGDIVRVGGAGTIPAGNEPMIDRVHNQSHTTF